MCGIYGWTFGPKADAEIGAAQREVLSCTLAVANANRGPHAWGVYMARREQSSWENEIIRRIGNMASVRGVGTFGQADTMMGHTRWRTTGDNTVENAHPFVVGGVTLAHNGMIYNHKEIAAKYRRTDCTCDSKHLAYHVNEGRDFDELEGYGAIEYARAEVPGSVYLSRMSGGELTVYGLGKRSAPCGVVWSSSGAHLRSAIKAARIDSFPYEKMKEGRVYLADADGVLYLCEEKTKHTLSETRTISRYDRLVTSGLGGKSNARDEAWARIVRDTSNGHTYSEADSDWDFSKADWRDHHAPLKPGQYAERDLCADLDAEAIADEENDAAEMIENESAAWLAAHARADSEP